MSEWTWGQETWGAGNTKADVEAGIAGYLAADVEQDDAEKVIGPDGRVYGVQIVIELEPDSDDATEPVVAVAVDAEIEQADLRDSRSGWRALLATLTERDAFAIYAALEVACDDDPDDNAEYYPGLHDAFEKLVAIRAALVAAGVPPTSPETSVQSQMYIDGVKPYDHE